MKRFSALSLIILVFQVALFAQDYKVTAVEHLQNDMTARKVILTERVNGGQQCAVLRIATQNILDLQRDLFQFECDMGSTIRERRKDGGEICLWVSPGIKILKIKHNNLGNYILNIPEMLKDNVQSLNTYRINIVGLQELPKETLAYGKCQMVFLPHPYDATLFINGDSIGTGSHTITSLSGDYHWMVKHPLYQTEEGTVTLTKGKIDSISVNLIPNYGYIKIIGNDKDGERPLEVYINNAPKGNVPFTSDKLSAGIYEVTLKAGDTIKAKSQMEVKRQQISVNRADELKWYYERALNINKHMADYNRTNNPLGNYMSINNEYNTIDSLAKTRRTQYYPITGKVTIQSRPKAWVTVDSVKYGLTPVTIDSLSVGPHHLELAAGDYTTIKQEINVVEENVLSYSFQLKRSCMATIISDRPDDQVFVNGEYVGKTPVTIERPFGTYSIRINRPYQYTLEGTLSYNLEEKVSLTPDDLEPTIYLPLGQTVHIETGNKKAKLFRDNKYIGRTPMELFIANGQHIISVEHGWREGRKEITISKDSLICDLHIDTHPLNMSSFMKRGAFFMTGNIGLFKEGKSVWGLNIGDIGIGGQAGWYLSIMTNGEFLSQIYHKDYAVLNAQTLANDHGNIDGGQQPTYLDEESHVRFSAQLGLALKLGGPVYLRIGAGYGIRRTAWKTDKNSWVIIDPYSWKDFEGSLGLQCHFYNIVVNADALIPVKETIIAKKGAVEFRIGLGFCVKHKR